MTTFRVGVDIGGTFTDATLVNEATGETHVAKLLSTPEDPSVGFLKALQRLLTENQVDPTALSYVVHGTTVATNAIIEGTIARTGFVTTEGFRDMLEIARQIRPTLYDLQFEKPRPLSPRHLCFGVPERVDARGKVVTPLNEDAVRAVGQALQQQGAHAIAVCLLHSYVNPMHERRVGHILREVFPEASISLSAEIAPEFREYFRASTTLINACVQPIVARYLSRVEASIREYQVEAELLVMQSSGGVYPFAAAARKPVFMIESGPAAGVIAAAHLTKALGIKDALSFDMGGTTAKVGLIQDGAPQITKDYEVGQAAGASIGASRGAGYPIRTPVIDLVEIGAGGGSIAWVDSGGSLRVGPQSAGADPGPACYGQGGQEPTITDANLVLGRLSADYFLGGEMDLQPDAAWRAIEAHCAQPLTMDVISAAHGILEIANATMVNALRLISVQRGHDPRRFALIAFGGAGPVHVNRLADENEIPLTVVPASPGTFSALGLLVTDLKHDYSVTLLRPLARLEPAEADAGYRRLEDRGREALRREGIAEENVHCVRKVDMRYVGQSFELSLPVPHGRLKDHDLQALRNAFHQAHDHTYGFSAPQEPVELVNLRLTAIGRIAKPRPHELPPHSSDASQARKTSRPVHFVEAGGFVDCPVYERQHLGSGCRIVGPAIVEEIDSTTVIHPGYAAAVDPYGNLLLRKKS